MKQKLIVIVLLTLLLVVSCSKSNEKTVKVGVIGPLSGNFAYFGQEEQKGLEIAKELINNNNELKVELVYEDSKADLKEAVNVLLKLLGFNSLSFVIGDAWGSSTTPLVPIANEKKIILISPVATQKSLSQDDYFYRTIDTIDTMTKELASFAFNVLNVRKVAILEIQTPYGVEYSQYFQKYFEILGGQIVAKESFNINDRDLKTQLTKIKETNPDAIFNLHGGELFGLVIKQAKELGIDNVIWLGHFGTENAPLLKSYADILDNVYYPHPFNPISIDQEFATVFQSKYSESPNMIAFNSFKALNILYEAVRNVGQDSKKVKEYLDKSNYFDNNGDIQQEIYIKTIKDGEFVVLK